MNRVSVKIKDSAGGHILVDEFTLPAVLGRGAAATIQFAEDQTNISRQHAEIKNKNGLLWITHLGSRNSTTVNGQKLSQEGAEAALQSGDHIVIGDYTIEIEVQEEPISQASNGISALLVVSHESDRDFASTAMVSIDPKGVSIKGDIKTGAFSVHSSDDGPAINDHRETIARIEFSGDQGQFATVDGVDPALVRINTVQLTSSPHALRHFDLIEVGDLRIEIANLEPVLLRCVNTSCHRINPYRVGANCRYCGFRLVESQSLNVRGPAAPKQLPSP